MRGNISELVWARLGRGIAESAHRDRALFRLGELDAHRRAIHRFAFGLTESAALCLIRPSSLLYRSSVSRNLWKINSGVSFEYLATFCIPYSLSEEEQEDRKTR